MSKTGWINGGITNYTIAFLESFHIKYTAFKRWWFNRPIITPHQLGRPLTHTEKLRNLSRALYGDDRLLP